MAQHTFNDGSSGSVVIRSGPPSSGAGSGGGFGSGGGVSGGFGKTSKGKRKARKRAIEADRKAREQASAQAAAQAQAEAAQAQEQARVQARLQLLAGFAQRHAAIKVEVDQRFAARSAQLAPALEQEVLAARRWFDYQSSERLQLYIITRDKSEIDGLIARKTTELNGKNAVARSFDGHDPLTRTANDYRARLEQFGEALVHGHQTWENAYNAAHEARLLSAQVNALTGKSNALAAHHAEQTIVWREREAIWEAQRQYVKQREARVRFKQQVDEDARGERVRQANTLSLPGMSSVTSAGVLFNPSGVWAGGSANALQTAVSRAIAVFTGVLATVTAPQVVIFVVGMTYPSELGNGELTPEQRERLFQGNGLHGLGVNAELVGLRSGQDLQSIADSGGSAQVEFRLKPQAIPDGTAIIVASTAGEIGASVPVINAVLDPLTGTYNAEIPGSPNRHLQFTGEATPQSAIAHQPGLAVMTPQIQDIPAGVDLRIQDCIVCVPGLPPIYMSFNLPPIGSGIVTGTGQPAANDWWKTASQTQGAAIPVQIGDQFRGREIPSFSAFDEALWRTVGEHPALVAEFDEVNKKRIEQGFTPYAPKSTWVGERREFELRYQERAELGATPFNLDKISITTPQSTQGRQGITPVVLPWPIRPVGGGTWTPLVPPGIEHLGPTTSPITPPIPAVYPGAPAIPVLPQNETFPAVDEGQIGASIPGYPGDMELPSPDVLFLDRRDDPGVATGFGQSISGIWLGESARAEGAHVPAQIAERLRGREFANFHRFREAFWKAVAADKDLSKQFNNANLIKMIKGAAPYPGRLDQVGGRRKFEIHHKDEVAKGGAVYDMENLLIMTAKRHIEFHKGAKQ